MRRARVTIALVVAVIVAIHLPIAYTDALETGGGLYALDFDDVLGNVSETGAPAAVVTIAPVMHIDVIAPVAEAGLPTCDAVPAASRGPPADEGGSR